MFYPCKRHLTYSQMFVNRYNAERNVKLTIQALVISNGGNPFFINKLRVLGICYIICTIWYGFSNIGAHYVCIKDLPLIQIHALFTTMGVEKGRIYVTSDIWIVSFWGNCSDRIFCESKFKFNLIKDKMLIINRTFSDC